MKKTLTLAIALLSFVGMANAQQRMLQITRTNGSVVNYEYNSVESVSFSNSNDWQTIGMGEYTEGVLSDYLYLDYLGDMIDTWAVEVQENIETPGLYRIRNPYADYPKNYLLLYYIEDAYYDDTQSHYLEIDATNPDCVWIRTVQYTGWYIGEYYGGDFSIWSMAAYWMEQGYTWDEEVAYGDFGTLRDGVITFPDETLILQLGYYTYSANLYGNFRLVLPDAVQNSKSHAPTQTTAKEGATLQRQEFLPIPERKK